MMPFKIKRKNKIAGNYIPILIVYYYLSQTDIYSSTEPPLQCKSFFFIKLDARIQMQIMYDILLITPKCVARIPTSKLICNVALSGKYQHLTVSIASFTKFFVFVPFAFAALHCNCPLYFIIIF